MNHTPTTTNVAHAQPTSDNSSIFGLYYLEEHEFDLNEIVGCFGASAIDAVGIASTTTCPYDDSDSFDEHPD